MSEEDKWKNLIGPNENQTEIVGLATTIKLKSLTPKDISEQIFHHVHKKSRKNIYFTKDEKMTLTDEDIEYQMVDISDIVSEKNLLPKLLKEDLSIKESWNKLLRIPERSLSRKLLPYFTRNLKYAGDVTDFVISYEELQKDIKRILHYRKYGKHRELLSLKYNQQHIVFSMFNEPWHEHTISNKTRFDRSITYTNNNEKDSLLKKIDNDFKPTILLSTKTYTRKKLNSQ